MAVSPDDVRYIAALARLHLDDAEVDRLTVQLRSILAHVEQLSAAEPSSDDEGIQPMEHAPPPRTDAPSADPLHVPPARFAVAWLDGFFTLPRLEAMDTDGDEDGGA